jgi:tRNA uridine 5-carboxymethylaminomethyl modification enzyme
MEHYEVIVVGGGHAGIEAACAASHMGLATALITGDLGRIGEMSCNPAIGGVGKGQLVREVDALGGMIGRFADEAGIHFRVLNRSKGPAVWSSRAQADRKLYRESAQAALRKVPNLALVEGMVVAITVENRRFRSAVLEDGREIKANAAVVVSGTFLNGIIHIGDKKIPAGRINEAPALGLTESLLEYGFKSGRLKTGTPPRLDGDTIDFGKTESQPGDEDIRPFSMRTSNRLANKALCYITYTTEKTHAVIRRNLTKSAMFSGNISGVGPRYCPSIEDKVHRFADKPRHQLFIEPEGLDTDEIYINGLSTSLPEDVQLEIVHSIPGLENVTMNRPGYAIEYDFFPAYQIKPTLETRPLDNLYFAGQINGTSGYEEAAAQGLIAGINAALKLKNEEPFYLDRSEAYIGVMIDDLITKIPVEPYRMFTSRAEYRLALREDNPADRLIEHGRRLRLVDDAIYDKWLLNKELIDSECRRLNSTTIMLSAWDPVNGNGASSSLAKLLKRPEVTYGDLARVDEACGVFPALLAERVQIRVKYEGYLDKQAREIERFRKLESQSIPDDFEYDGLTGLKREAVETLSKFRPINLGQASRLAGVTYSDLTALMIHLRKWRDTVSRETAG